MSKYNWNNVNSLRKLFRYLDASFFHGLTKWINESEWVKGILQSQKEDTIAHYDDTQKNEVQCS